MLELKGQSLTLEQIAAVAYVKETVSLSQEARAQMEAARRVIEEIIASGQVVYGVNTGFGKLSDVHIPPDELRALQLNLVRSHACGVGPLLSEEEVRVMLLLRANVLAKGFSGARPVVAETLIAMLNRGVHPVIPSKGSVGASGDLAPLAHLSLTVIGEGEAFYKGERMTSADALRRTEIEPLSLEAKEGIALLNGTQAMAAVGSLALYRAEKLAWLADVAGAMTLEALRGTPAAFDPRIHAARPHIGQTKVAQHLLELLQESEIRKSHLTNDPRVQDAYCLRCMPQVHGAVRDALRHAREKVEIESGSATDNPLVFFNSPSGILNLKSGISNLPSAISGEEISNGKLQRANYDVISGGNFHGAPLALVFDYASIALTDLASISERRTDRLVNPDSNEGLPPFLTKNAGTSSGFMMAQVAAVALLNEMKVLAHPASIDNVPTDGGKEDHVSMGMTAANKLSAIVDSLELVIAMELLAAAEGLEHRKPLKPGKGVFRVYEKIREHVEPLTQDRVLSNDFKTIADLIRNGAFEE
jgi:histidine ammonia-lyase